MKRRDFIHAAAAVGATGLLPLGIARSGNIGETRFSLLRSASDAAGSHYRPIGSAPGSDGGAPVMRVHMDGMFIAQGGAVLDQLSLHAMFDRPGFAAAPFIAWHYAAGSPVRMSQRMSFVAGRASMRGFELDYRVAGETACSTERCGLTRLDALLLQSGHYLLAGPNRSGARVDALTLRHSGDPLAPLAGAQDFDYLAFRIAALA